MLRTSLMLAAACLIASGATAQTGSASAGMGAGPVRGAHHRGVGTPVPGLTGLMPGRGFRDDRRGGDRRHRNWRARDLLPIYSGGGYGLSSFELSRDAGFFAEGALARRSSGQVIYDYDRGYPYDFYRGASRAPAPEQYAETSWQCSVERSVRVCRR